MKNLEFQNLLDNANTVESIIGLRNIASAPSYIRACKVKLLESHEDYVWYNVPLGTLKKYTNHTDCGECFLFFISITARGNFKDLRGCWVRGYVIEKKGSRFQEEVVLLKRVEANKA